MGYYYLEWGWGLSKIRKLDLNLQVTIIHDDFGSVTHSSGYLALRVRGHRYIHWAHAIAHLSQPVTLFEWPLRLTVFRDGLSWRGCWNVPRLCPSMPAVGDRSVGAVHAVAWAFGDVCGRIWVCLKIGYPKIRFLGPPFSDTPIFIYTIDDLSIYTLKVVSFHGYVTNCQSGLSGFTNQQTCRWEAPGTTGQWFGKGSSLFCHMFGNHQNQIKSVT